MVSLEALIEKVVSGVQEEDRQLLDELFEHTPKIQVFGVGGAGNNAVSRLLEAGIEGAELIAVNTDAQDLASVRADRKILIGRETTKGLGAGNDPEVGEAAAKESIEELKEAISADMVFVTCGLGGGTGTGAAPIIAEAARKMGILTVSVCTLPFIAEGVKRWRSASSGLKKLSRNSDTLIVIPNDKLLEVAPNLSLIQAFRLADEILIRGVKAVAELVTKPGLVNVDLADIRTIVKKGGTALISLGEASGERKEIEAVEDALNSPLLDVDLKSANGALVNVSGDQNLKLHEAESVVRVISDRIGSDAEIIWGALIDPTLKDKLRVSLVVSGVAYRYVEQILSGDYIFPPELQLSRL
ncbi:MAG: cell division protein FtsZ [Candidatus Freyarchaeota archaeon]|nr:cell division protein FtsZ [Candidatus Freyrarchaeum guaymaensis]